MRSRIATPCCQAKHAKCRVLQAMRVLLPSISAKPTSHSPVSSRHAQGPFGKQVSQAKEWTKAHCHILLSGPLQVWWTLAMLVAQEAFQLVLALTPATASGLLQARLMISCHLAEQITLLDQASASFRGTLCRTGCSALITGYGKLYQALHDTSLQNLRLRGVLGMEVALSILQSRSRASGSFNRPSSITSTAYNASCSGSSCRLHTKMLGYIIAFQNLS